MIGLSETVINQTSPYKVSKDTNNDTLTFLTDNAVLYHIGFIEDHTLDSVQRVYQLYVENVCSVKGPIDDKVRQTVTCILEQFFQIGDVVLFYVCDTRDGRQAIRNRLFSHWFGIYKNKDSFLLKTASIQVEENKYYASMLIHKENPRYEYIVSKFNEFVVDFDSK